MAGEFAVYTSVAVGGKRTRPTKKETREQIIARNSFPSVNDNKYLDKILKEIKNV